MSVIHTEKFQKISNTDEVLSIIQGLAEKPDDF
jgi:hypothetical protein